ncbi:DNA-binding regulatory protein, YebC/PmpR family [Cooperia oncophora]
MLPSAYAIARRGLCFSSGLFKGHSKWQNIKATKGKNDMLRSKAITTLLTKVKAAVAHGGYDTKLNRELAALEQEFRSKGLPLDTFKNFLTKMKEKPEVDVQFNVIGPSGTFFIIEAETDSKRALENTMRKYFNKVGGFRFASEASAVLSWFEQKGVLSVKRKMEEIGIELDCEDVSLVEDEGRVFELVCDPGKLAKVEKALTSKGLIVESAELQFRPLHPIKVESEDAAKIEKLYEYLQEDESIRQIFDNIVPAS